MQQVSNSQLDQVKSLLKDHLESHKFFDSLKSAIAKDPKLATLDRNAIIEKLKNEGVLNDILQQIPVKRQANNQEQSAKVQAYEVKKLQSKTSGGGTIKLFNQENLDPNRRYLSVKIVHLKAFIDFMNAKDDEYVFVTISFLHQRFQSQINFASVDVEFPDETFIFDFAGKDQDQVKFDPAQLMKLNQMLHVTILRQKKNEKAVVMGTKNIDWRPLLHTNSIEINAEILPIDLTHQGSLGLIQLHLDIIPQLTKIESLNEDVVMKQLSLERKFESESLQKFLDYANEWWNEYKGIRHSHKQRLVKIFAETDDREASVYKPVCSLIQPMIADRVGNLETPLHAARFVSLIPFQRLEAPGKDKVEVWHSMQSFLSRGCGDSEDHAVLLCNLLLGFSLEAYVCIGTNSEGSHAWVLTKTLVESGKKKVHFWESLTGQKLDFDDPRVHRFYRTVGCVFNHKFFFANVQADDRVINTNWNFEDEFMWKGMLPSMINTLSPSQGLGYLMPSTMHNVGIEEKQIENILKEKIGSIRMNDEHVSTSWDGQLSYLLQSALMNYEMERIGGVTFANEEFQSSIKNYVPEGHVFKALPVQFTHFDTERMIHHIYNNKVGKEIMLSRGDQMKHAVRVKIVTYPENVCAVWVMIASRFRSIH